MRYNIDMDIKQNKIVFFGTPEFAKIILKKLVDIGCQPAAIVTAPDKPAGRKHVITHSPVKELVLEYNLKIFQPKTLKNNQDIIDHLSIINPDIFIIAAYGLILPKEILNIPKYGCLNIHPSLLPKYRGASPIQAAILNQDKITGITIIKMDEKIDHGPILAMQELKITNYKLQITNQELSNKLAWFGGELLIKTLPEYLDGNIKPIPQDHTKATFTKRIKKQDGKIDWNKSASYIDGMTRAYYPWPGTYTTINSKLSTLNNKILKIIKIDILNISHDRKPGIVFLADKKQLAVACGKNVLVLKKIQLEGKKPMSGKDFFNGYPNILDSILT